MASLFQESSRLLSFYMQFRQNARDNTLVAVAAGQLVALLHLTLLGDVHAHELIDARSHVVAVFAAKAIDAHNAATGAMRHLEGRVATLASLSLTDKEKAEIVAGLEGKKFDVQRSKGLGENDPEMMWLTTMSPESRRLIKVLPTDVQRTAEVFDLLLGDNLQGRKEHIAEHGAEYLDDLDVS